MKNKEQENEKTVLEISKELINLNTIIELIPLSPAEARAFGFYAMELREKLLKHNDLKNALKLAKE